MECNLHCQVVALFKLMQTCISTCFLLTVPQNIEKLQKKLFYTIRDKAMRQFKSDDFKHRRQVLVNLILTSSDETLIPFNSTNNMCIHFNFLQSGERNGTPSRRSKSEGPPLANGRCVNALDNVSDEKQIKEKVFSMSLIFKTECGMSVHHNLIHSYHKYLHTTLSITTSI